MKHVQLFENFERMSELFSAIGIFLETDMGVGVFPTHEANLIYEKLTRMIPPTEDYINVEMVEVPEGHDLIIVPLGGKGISTSNEEEMEGYGDPVYDFVELGKNNDFGEDDSQMAFKVEPNVGGFVFLDYTGGTRLVKPTELFDFMSRKF